MLHACTPLSLVQGWSHALSFSLVKLGSQDAPVAPLLMLAVKYEPKPTGLLRTILGHFTVHGKQSSTAPSKK
jgi:hypothetical protein